LETQSEPANKIIALNTILTHYANVQLLCRLSLAMADDQNGLPLAYSNDGVHPNKAGYEVMAPLLEKAIEFTRNDSSKP
jgi:lysophospholipase L1-like esterase